MVCVWRYCLMPILGITASQITGRLSAPDTGAMFPLGMVQVGSGGTSSVSFSSIPSTYKHLQIRGISQCTNVKEFHIQINSDTGSNYSYHNLYGNGSSAGAAGASTQDKIATLTQVGSATATSTFSALVIDILDYSLTSKYKTLRILSGTNQNNTTDEMGLTSGLWQSTSAINTIKLFPTSTGTFTQYTQFALYGIKGA